MYLRCNLFTEKNPTDRIWIFVENLAKFKDGTGRLGLKFTKQKLETEGKKVRTVIKMGYFGAKYVFTIL